MFDAKYWEQRWMEHGEFGTIGRASFSSWHYYRRGVEIYDAIREHLPSHCTCLIDYGCGAGRMTPYLLAHCDQYVGIEPNPEAADRAHDRFGMHNGVGFWMEPPVMGGGVEAIVFSMVMQHIVDDGELESLLKRCNKWLKPGGKIIALENTSNNDDAPHIKFRSCGTYCKLISDAALRCTPIAELRFDGERHTLFVATEEK